ncbi:hypothetical protein ABPG72_009325 [Tetrahymena utriculariae]
MILKYNIYQDLQDFLCSTLQTHKGLHINLLWNNFTKKGCKVLGSSISKCHNLQNLELDMMDCKVGYQGASNIGAYLSNCSNISSLTLCLEYFF